MSITIAFFASHGRHAGAALPVFPLVTRVMSLFRRAPVAEERRAAPGPLPGAALPPGDDDGHYLRHRVEALPGGLEALAAAERRRAALPPESHPYPAVEAVFDGRTLEEIRADWEAKRHGPHEVLRPAALPRDLGDGYVVIGEDEKITILPAGTLPRRKPLPSPRPGKQPWDTIPMSAYREPEPSGPARPWDPGDGLGPLAALVRPYLPAGAVADARPPREVLDRMLAGLREMGHMGDYPCCPCCGDELDHLVHTTPCPGGCNGAAVPGGFPEMTANGRETSTAAAHQAANGLVDKHLAIKGYPGGAGSLIRYEITSTGRRLAALIQDAS